MKKIFLKTFMPIAITVSFSAVADAQLVVKVRPEPHVLLGMPITPSPKHAWVSGEWV